MDDKIQSGLSVFVTVGSTSFDALIRTVSTETFLQQLYNNGFRSVVIQYGRGELPQIECGYKTNLPDVRSFTYSDSLSSEMQAADVILSHGGSGTIFEALDMGKRLVVVPNRSLMHDHQMELADELLSRGLIEVSDAQNADDVLAKVVQASKRPPPQKNPIPRNRYVLANIIAQELGWI